MEKIIEQGKKGWELVLSNKELFKEYFNNDLITFYIDEQFKLLDVKYVKERIFIKISLIRLILNNKHLLTDVSGFIFYGLEKALKLLEHTAEQQKQDKLNITDREFLIDNCFFIIRLNKNSKNFINNLYK